MDPLLFSRVLHILPVGQPFSEHKYDRINILAKKTLKLFFKLYTGNSQNLNTQNIYSFKLIKPYSKKSAKDEMHFKISEVCLGGKFLSGSP